VHREDAPHRDVREHRDLLHHLLVHRVLGPAGDELRLDAGFHQALDAQLRGLRLLLAEDGGLQDVGERHEAAVLRSLLEGQLAQRLDVEAVLVVAGGAAHLDEHHVAGLAVVAGHRQLPQAHLHRAGDVRDHLHVAAEVAAAALALQDLGVDLAGGDEVAAAQVLVQDTLVRAEVHVGLQAVLEHEHLAVAVGVQRAAVDVQVALHLDGGDGESLVLEELGQRAGEDPLAEAAHHGADDDDVLRPPGLVAAGRGAEGLV
jgi:hypothetical protein